MICGSGGAVFWGQSGVGVAGSAVGWGVRGSRLLRAVPQKLTINPVTVPISPPSARPHQPHQPRPHQPVPISPLPQWEGALATRASNRDRRLSNPLSLLSRWRANSLTVCSNSPIC